jgi:hypothetical protein
VQLAAALLGWIAGWVLTFGRFNPRLEIRKLTV